MEASDIGKENERPVPEVGTGGFKVPEPVKPKETHKTCDTQASQTKSGPDTLALYTRTKVVQGSSSSKFNILADIKVPPSVTVRKRIWEQTPHKKITGSMVPRSSIPVPVNSEESQINVIDEKASLRSQANETKIMVQNHGEATDEDNDVLQSTDVKVVLDGNLLPHESGIAQVSPTGRSETENETHNAAHISSSLVDKSDSRNPPAEVDLRTDGAAGGTIRFDTQIEDKDTTNGDPPVVSAPVVVSATDCDRNRMNVATSEASPSRKINPELHASEGIDELDAPDSALKVSTEQCTNVEGHTAPAKVPSENESLSGLRENIVNPTGHTKEHERTESKTKEGEVVANPLVNVGRVSSDSTPSMIIARPEGVADEIVTTISDTNALTQKNASCEPVSTHEVQSSDIEENSLSEKSSAPADSELEDTKNVEIDLKQNQGKTYINLRTTTEVERQEVTVTETVYYQEGYTRTDVDTATVTAISRTDTAILKEIPAPTLVEPADGTVRTHTDEMSLEYPADMAQTSVKEEFADDEDVESNPISAHPQGVVANAKHELAATSTLTHPKGVVADSNSEIAAHDTNYGSDMTLTTSSEVVNTVIESTTTMKPSTDANIIMAGTEITTTECTEKVNSVTLEVDTIMTDAEAAQAIGKSGGTLSSPKVQESEERSNVQAQPDYTPAVNGGALLSGQPETDVGSHPEVETDSPVIKQTVEEGVTSSTAEMEVAENCKMALETRSETQVDSHTSVDNEVDKSTALTAEDVTSPNQYEANDAASGVAKIAEVTITKDMSQTSCMISSSMGEKMSESGGVDIEARHRDHGSDPTNDVNIPTEPSVDHSGIDPKHATLFSTETSSVASEGAFAKEGSAIDAARPHSSTEKVKAETGDKTRTATEKVNAETGDKTRTEKQDNSLDLVEASSKVSMTSNTLKECAMDLKKDEVTDGPDVEETTMTNPQQEKLDSFERGKRISVSSLEVDGDHATNVEATTPTSLEKENTPNTVCMREEEVSSNEDDVHDMVEHLAFPKTQPEQGGANGDDNASENTESCVVATCVDLDKGHVDSHADEAVKSASDVCFEPVNPNPQMSPEQTEGDRDSMQIHNDALKQIDVGAETATNPIQEASKVLGQDQGESQVDDGEQKVTTGIRAQDTTTHTAAASGSIALGSSLEAGAGATLSNSSSLKRDLPQDHTTDTPVKAARHCVDADVKIPEPEHTSDAPSSDESSGMSIDKQPTATKHVHPITEIHDSIGGTAKRKLEDSSDELMPPERHLKDDGIHSTEQTLEAVPSRDARDGKRVCYTKEHNTSAYTPTENTRTIEDGIRPQELREPTHTTSQTPEEITNEKVDTTLKELNELRQKQAGLVTEVDRLENAVAKAQETLLRMETERCQFESDCAKFKEDAEHARLINVELNSDKIAQASTIAKIMIELENVEKMHGHVETEVAEVKAEYSEILKKFESKTGEMQKIVDERTLIEKEREILKGENDDLKRSNLSSLKNLEEAQVECTALEAKLSESSAKLGPLERSRDALSEELSAVRSVAAKLPELENKVGTLQAELEQVPQLEKTIATLRAEIASQVSDVDMMRQANNALTSEMGTLREDLKELPGLREKTTELQAEIERMVEAKQNMSLEVQRVTEVLEKVRTERDAFADEIKTLKQAAEEVQGLKNELNSLRQENANIKETQAASAVTKEEVDTLRQDSEQLLKERDTLLSDKCKLEEERKSLQAATSEFAETKQELLKLQEEATVYTTELSALSAAKADLTERLQKMGDCVQDNLRLALEVKTLKSQTEEVERLREENQALAAETKLLKEGAVKMKKLSEDNTLMADEVLRLRGNITELEAKSQEEKNTRGKLARVENELTNSQRDLSTLEDSFGQLNERYRKMKEINANLYKNEGLLKQATQKNLNIINSKEERYNLLKEHAQAKIAEGNAQLEQQEATHAREKATWAAKQNITEMNLQTLEKKIATQEEEYDSLKKLYVMTQNLVVQLQQSQ